MQTEIKPTPNDNRRALDYNRYANTNEDESTESDPTLEIEQERETVILYQDTAFIASYGIVRDIWFDYGHTRS